MKTALHLLAFLLLSTSILSAQNTYHVDCSASAGGDGMSWATAFNDLQNALTIASSGDLIVVAQGAYSPSTSDPTVAFVLVNGVGLYGGYLNTDINLTQRDPVNNVTILTGSLGADCNGNGGGGNAYTVIYSNHVSAATVVDGFTITEGYANEPCSGALLQRHGGGWYNDGAGSGNTSSPTVRNCVFLGNQSTCGGGAFFNDGNFFGSASPSFEKCTFEGNYSDAVAGAFYNNGNAGTTNPSFTNCKFIANGTNLSSVSYGGAMYNFGKNGNANPTFINCLFQENGAYAGAGIYNLGENGNANPQFINCTFYGNAATANGGSIYANAGNAPSIGNANPYVVNCIFFANTAAPFLGPIFRNNNGNITVQNCLFDVAADCMELNSGVGPDVICNGINIFSGDPLFVNEAAGDFNLSATSPAVNAGENGAIGGIPLDLDGNNRIQQGTVDLGPLESAYSSLPAPIELLEFDAKAAQGVVNLSWSTLSEKNSEVFIIERSDNGIQFEDIGEVPGAGTSSLTHVYDAIDAHPYPGYNYYRLRQLDFDNKVTLSEIKVVNFSTLEVEIFPNPVQDDLHLSISSYARGEVRLEISNVVGKILYSGTMPVDQQKTTITFSPVKDLEAGTYFLRVFDGGKNSEIRRFVKVND